MTSHALLEQSQFIVGKIVPHKSCRLFGTYTMQFGQRDGLTAVKEAVFESSPQQAGGIKLIEWILIKIDAKAVVFAKSNRRNVPLNS